MDESYAIYVAGGDSTSIIGQAIIEVRTGSWSLISSFLTICMVFFFFSIIWLSPVLFVLFVILSSVFLEFNSRIGTLILIL